MLADAAQVTADGKLWMLGGNIESIGALSFPAIHPALALILKVVWEPSDGHRVPLTISALAEGEQFAPPFTQVLDLATARRAPDGNYAFVFSLNYFTLQFERPGIYSFQLSVNQAAIAERRFNLAATPAVR